MIIGISGKKQSGKNTTANILHGIVLKERNLIKDFRIDSEGKLVILTENTNGDEGWGEFDVARKDAQFVDYAERNMWPYVKLYSFADALKWIATELFDIPPECVYGTDDQKNQKQNHLLWENMPRVYTGRREPIKRGLMTSREFLQFFGTEVMRQIWAPVWVNKCIKDIKREGSLLAVIADVRFPNEAQAVEGAGGLMWRLDRDMHADDHVSESALDDYPFSSRLENQDGTIAELVGKVQNLFRPVQIGVSC